MLNACPLSAMRRRPLLSAVSLLIVVIAVVPSFGLWGRFPNDKSVKADKWPQSIVKAINAHRRVYGAGSYDGAGRGWTFYFVGNTDDVNRFLAQVAEDKLAALHLVLDGEAGTANVMSEPMGKSLKIDYTWALYLYLNREFVMIEPKAGETDQQANKRLEQARAKVPEFGARVIVHCGGAVDQTALKLPLRFKASVGGRLAKLADFHNERRERLEKSGKLSGQPPTDMPAAEAPRGLFGGPSTQPADGDGG
jgi:hypothetical protein